MSGHTKGPWAIEGDSATGERAGHYVILTGKHGDSVRKIIARIYSHLDLDAEGEIEANARLIASAPALLALVERFASECGECGGKGYIEIPDTCDTTYYEDNMQTFPCPDCADLRQVLAAVREGEK